MKNSACLLLLLLWLPVQALAAGLPAPNPLKVRQRAEEAVAVRVDTQKKLDAFHAEESKLLDKSEALAKELKLIRFQREKTESYVRDQQAKVAELKRRAEEIARIKAELEELLDRGKREFKNLIDSAAYHFPQINDKRYDELQKALNNYDLGLAQKTKQVFDALAGEARKGQAVRVWEGPVEMDGGVLHVKLIRLGRLALFALDQAGQRAWRYLRTSKRFQPLEGWARDLNKLAEIAQRQRIAALAKVPLPPETQGGAK